MSMFLRPKLRKKLRSLEANGGRLRLFEAKVKLWVSKFIFFHADSGNGLKHNFEAVLSFKSLFEKVPEDLQGSDFV